MDDLLRMSGTLKKLKTQKKKFFVLFAGGSGAGARLEYHDSEKKFKSGSKAKRSILLQNCLNISKRPDSKHKYALMIFTKEDSLGVVFEDEKELNEWLKALQLLQAEIRITRRYDHVWEVQVKEKGLKNMKYLTAGAYRMYLTNKNLGFTRANQEDSDIELPLATIRSCGHAENFFNLEIGSASVTGEARIWMQVEDAVIAQNMHEIVLSTMKSSSVDIMRPPAIFRNRTPTGESKSRTNSTRRPTKRRNTFSHGGHSRDSVIHAMSDTGPRSRTDSVSSHGSHRTDHSAQSSDVEAESFNSEHSLCGHSTGKPKGRRDKSSRKSVLDDTDDRIFMQKDITVSPSQESGSDVTDASSYMEMAASQKLRARVSESESSYFPMMGSSPANSTASSGVGLEEGSYFEMHTRMASSPSDQNTALDAGYMEMKTGQVSRSYSATLKPDKVSSLLSDDSSCGGVDEFPPRANSVGSKPSALQRSERLNESYMDMSWGDRRSQGAVNKAQDKCCSAPHLPAHSAINPLLRNNNRANSPSIRSNDSSRCTTPRSGTPSQHLDSDLLMELDFASGSHESLSDFRSRASSAGSRDFHSSGFGSHDIRDRTGSMGSRDSSMRFHDGHRPRTSTIGQETLRPRTSSFGPADMRPRAASYGAKFKDVTRDLSRRVKEKQQFLRMQEPKKLRGSSSRDSVGSGGSSKQTDLSIIRSRSQEYRATLTLPEEEYMTLTPPMPSTPPGSVNTPPRSVSSHLHSTPTHESHLKSSKHVHMSPDIKTFIEESNTGAAKRPSSYRKDRSHGSSSESLSSSSSDMGPGLKTKHSARSKKSSAAVSVNKVASSSDKSDYIDASPQAVSNLTAQNDADDSYFVYEPGQGQDRSPKSSFSGLEKVISPIRDDISLSTFQIVSPIKEEDNDALFGPKPKTVDKETLERLRELKHEYVNVDFDEKKSHQNNKNNSIKDSHNDNSRSEMKNPSPSIKNTDTTFGYNSNPRDHDYMEIDISKTSTTSSDASKTGPSSLNNSSSSKSSDSNEKSEQAVTNLVVDTNKLTLGNLGPSRFHDYCEINFDDVTSDNQTVSAKSHTSSIPDPFGELYAPVSLSPNKETKRSKSSDIKMSKQALSKSNSTEGTAGSKKAPKITTIASSSDIINSLKDGQRSRTSSADPTSELSPSAQATFSSQFSDEANKCEEKSPATPAVDVFNLGAKPVSVSSPAACESDNDKPEKERRVSAGDVKPRSPVASGSSLSEQVKSTSQTTLSRANKNALQSSGSSTSLDAMSNSRNGNGTSALELPGSRRSYHENSALESSIGTRQTSRTSVNSDISNMPQLNYARLDLSSSTDEPGLNVVPREGQTSPSAATVQRSASFTVQAEDSAPISYAQIDFEKSEQLKQSEQVQQPEVQRQALPEQEEKQTEQAPPFDCI